jgi:hypothetical protein
VTADAIMQSLWAIVMHTATVHAVHHALREGLYIALAAEVGLLSGFIFDRFMRQR